MWAELWGGACRSWTKSVTVKFTSEKMSRNNLFKCHYTHIFYIKLLYTMYKTENIKR